jgi:hypothetical protein
MPQLLSSFLILLTSRSINPLGSSSVRYTNSLSPMVSTCVLDLAAAFDRDQVIQ